MNGETFMRTIVAILIGAVLACCLIGLGIEIGKVKSSDPLPLPTFPNAINGIE